MYDVGSTAASMPQRIPGKALSTLTDHPIDPALTRFRGVARVHLRNRLSAWALFAPASATPTFDQLMRMRNHLQA